MLHHGTTRSTYHCEYDVGPRDDAHKVLLWNGPRIFQWLPLLQSAVRVSQCWRVDGFEVFCKVQGHSQTHRSQAILIHISSTKVACVRPGLLTQPTLIFDNAMTARLSLDDCLGIIRAALIRLKCLPNWQLGCSLGKAYPTSAVELHLHPHLVRTPHVNGPQSQGH